MEAEVGDDCYYQKSPHQRRLPIASELWPATPAHRDPWRVVVLAVEQQAAAAAVVVVVDLSRRK